MSKRIEKVNEMLKFELSNIFLEKYNSLFEGLITITDVETATDLKDATIWVSVMGGDSDLVIESLNKKSREIKEALKERGVILRYMPNLHFKVDHTAEQAARVEELLEQIRKENKG